MTKVTVESTKSQSSKNWLLIIKNQLEKQSKLYNAQMIMAKK